MSQKIDFATPKVTVTFRLSGTITGTGEATLINLGGGLGRLLYCRSTGINDAGTGLRELEVQYPGVFSRIIGGAVNSYYALNSDSYQTHAGIYREYMDNYVYKASSASQTRQIQFDITGVLV